MGENQNWSHLNEDGHQIFQHNRRVIKPRFSVEPFDNVVGIMKRLSYQVHIIYRSSYEWWFSCYSGNTVITCSMHNVTLHNFH